MRLTLALATVASLFAACSAAPLEPRQGTDLSAIDCTGQIIVGNLVVRNPDQSTHLASFVKGDTDGQGRLKLTTKFNGVPSPASSKFAAQICTSYGYVTNGRRQENILTGFITPNNHRDKALTVAASGAGKPSSLVSDVKASSKFTRDSLHQWFHLYNNGTFYSLAYTGRESGNTAGFVYGPVSRRSSDSQDIFVEMKLDDNSQLIFDGSVNPFGYALELHP
ncbi:unnamed protein product [Tilletia controversa]|uniref:Uncharacterized protein n=1 Tax=Tilletia controversa TaxID=13291 RepID=A0A8X7MKC8_9BASI|nr:hypothetical protein CF328_g7455 [Tilletia controversa]KAE8239209.1 hypothetical protein A4X06_0g8451 [Tilletia controversa]CAD6917145.1 unnamed protein product [Tilletia controversa]CAD6982628.1 unnamed protein product [Tilletia controversa]